MSDRAAIFATARLDAHGAALAVPAAVLALAGGQLAMLPAAMLAAVLLLWAPGAFVVARAGLFDSAVARIAGSLALSPLLTGLPWAALRAAGMEAATAARLVLVLLALTGLFVRPRGADGRAAAAPTDAGEWLPAALWTLLVAALLIGVPSLPPRADGWFHAGVVLQVAERGLPPEDPYFAGLPLLYFWGMHAWAALALTIVPSLGVWPPLIAFGLAAAAASLLAVAAIARALGASARQAGWASALALLGWSPFGWIQVAGRALTGEVRGWPEVERLASAGADPMLVMLSAGQLHASMAFHGDKSLVLTPFGMGLALFALGLVTALPGPEGMRRPAAFALVLAAALFTHTVAGYALVLCAGLWGAAGIASRLRRREVPASAKGAWAIATLAAIVLLLPYLIAITAGKQGQLALSLQPAAFRTAVLGTGLFIGGAALWWRRPRPGTAPLLLAAALFLALGLTVRLSENNQSKFFNLLAMALAAPAALGLHAFLEGHRGRLRGLRRALIAGLLLPTPVLALWAFSREHGQAAGSWHEPSAESRAAFEWVRDHTTPATVFADLGGARELFTIAGRSVLWGGPDGERDWGHAPHALEVRRRAVSALCTGVPPDSEAVRMIAGLGRPVIVVARRDIPATDRVRALAAASEAGYRTLHPGAEVAFAVWEAPR